jgi:hypothetical protein
MLVYASLCWKKLISSLVLLICVFDVDHFILVFAGPVWFFDKLGKPYTSSVPVLPKKG